MQVFLANQDVTFTFDLNQVELDIASVEYRIVDGDEVELVARTAAPGFVPGSTRFSLAVPASLNQVPAVPPYDGANFVSPTAARTIYLYVTGTGAAAGTALLSQSYLLTLENRLLVPQLSFQTLVSAEQIALDMVDIDAWESASDSDKIAALIEAHFRISRLSFHFQPENWQSRVTPHVDVHDLGALTASEWQSLDANFKRDLRRAQLIEAAHVLTNDDHSASRELGIVSKTVGESSTTYLATRQARYPVSERAMKVIGRYLAPVRVARA